MRLNHIRLFAFVAAALLSVATFAQETAYVQQENIVYAEPHGIGLLMDIFVP